MRNQAPKVTTRKAWTDDDIHACIGLYNAFLFLQRKEEPYQKATHVRSLAAELERTKGSIEMKLMNISGVRHALGLDYVTGYKPLPNCQKRLVELVKAYTRIELENVA